MYLRLNAQRKILAHGYSGFEVLLALLAHKLSPKMRWPGGGEKDTKMLHFVICVFYDLFCNFPSGAPNESINHAHFPVSAVMYSSQEIVFGAGAVRDCLLTGWTQDRTIQPLLPQLSHRSNHRTIQFSLSHLEVVFADAASFTQALHDGFVPQDILLAEVFPTFAGLEHQAVDRVEVSQEVSHPFLRGKPRG